MRCETKLGKTVALRSVWTGGSAVASVSSHQNPKRRGKLGSSQLPQTPRLTIRLAKRSKKAAVIATGFAVVKSTVHVFLSPRSRTLT
jgi:hypothetical protein